MSIKLEFFKITYIDFIFQHRLQCKKLHYLTVFFVDLNLIYKKEAFVSDGLSLQWSDALPIYIYIYFGIFTFE